MDIASNIRFEDLIPYCIFPNSFIRNGKIPPQQKVLFEILCSYDHVDKNGQRKGWCDPGLDRVAEQMGLTKRAVQVHLKRLVESGMVIIVYRNTEVVVGSPRSSIYVLNILPGLSENDRKRIAAARSIQIKHLISGLNTIRVQTAKGMQYIAEQEFDLEYIVTGERSSTTMEGEIGDAEDVISTDEERKVGQSELYRFTGTQLKREEPTQSTGEEDVVISFTSNRNTAKKVDRSGFNSDNIIERISSGNYKGVTGKDLCLYFKHLFEINYPGEKYTMDYIKEPKIMTARLEKWDMDVFVPMIEFFIQRYDKYFFDKDYPRPRIYQLSIPWIINKLNEQFARAEKAKEDMAEPIQVQKDNPNVESRMF